MNYYFINTDTATVGREHPVDVWFDKGIAVVGGDAQYGAKLQKLEQGDICLMYRSGTGVIAIGDVLAPAGRAPVMDPAYYTGEGHLTVKRGRPSIRSQ